LGVIALAGLGLLAADVATYTSLRSFLFDRVDSTLDSVHTGVEALGGRGPGGPGGGQRVPGDCVELRTLTQQVVSHGCFEEFPNASTPPAPRYPATISLPSQPNTPAGDRVAFLTVPTVSGGGRYRVRASIEDRDP